jgi:hypothetical protein
MFDEVELTSSRRRHNPKNAIVAAIAVRNTNKQHSLIVVAEGLSRFWTSFCDL